MEPVFQVLEEAEIADLKAGPGRSIICAVATLLAFIGSIVLALLLNYLARLKHHLRMLNSLASDSE